MTTAGRGTDSAAATPDVPDRAPAPGGTARLAGRVVARIGFGAMQLEHRGADRSAALAILRQAAGAGVNHIDTAQFYDGCNALIREALSPYPDDLVLVSKVGADRDGSGKLVPGSRACRISIASSTGRPSPSSIGAASTASPGCPSSRSARRSLTGPG